MILAAFGAAAAMPCYAMAGCMEAAPDRDALIQCSKYELVMPEKREEQAWRRLTGRLAGDAAALAQLREDERRWGEARDARCAAEGRAHATAADGQATPLELNRAILLCLAREFTSRAVELEARLSAAVSAARPESAAVSAARPESTPPPAAAASGAAGR